MGTPRNEGLQSGTFRGPDEYAGAIGGRVRGRFAHEFTGPAGGRVMRPAWDEVPDGYGGCGEAEPTAPEGLDHYSFHRGESCQRSRDWEVRTAGHPPITAEEVYHALSTANLRDRCGRLIGPVRRRLIGKAIAKLLISGVPSEIYEGMAPEVIRWERHRGRDQEVDVGNDSTTLALRDVEKLLDALNLPGPSALRVSCFSDGRARVAVTDSNVFSYVGQSLYEALAGLKGVLLEALQVRLDQMNEAAEEVGR